MTSIKTADTEIKITIFTDGSSRGNPGPGGWGSVVVKGENVTEFGGGEKHTTNNRMELMAALEGLKSVPEGSSVALNTDSSYVINGITKWVKGWKRNGWKTKTKGDVVNKDIWVELDTVASARAVSWNYVGGHIGILGNERCDHIATAFADGRSVELYSGLLSNYDLPDILDVSHVQADLTKKKSSSTRANAKAYSYVSMVGGVIETHATWAECEKRVKGAKGAKFKKSTSLEDEQYVIKEFGTF